MVCAQGKAVLEVIEEEKLQENALKIGNRILTGLNQLKQKHNVIGDVRGKGLMLGIELVKDRRTKEPAKEECAEVVETAKDMGLLLGKGGLWGQTIRFLPANVPQRTGRGFPARSARSFAAKGLTIRECRRSC